MHQSKAPLNGGLARTSRLVWHAQGVIALTRDWFDPEPTQARHQEVVVGVNINT